MITVTGLGSGLDIEGLVTQLVAAERQGPEFRIASKEARARAELSAFGQISGALSSFQSAARGLDDPATYNRKLGNSSDSSSVGISVTSSAADALYNIEVSQLATRHSLASTAFTDSDTVVGTGTLTLRFGTTDYDAGSDIYSSFALNAERDILTLEIDSSNNTLQGISDAINAADAGVTAVVVNDGSGHKLLLSSAYTGAENSLEIAVADLDSNDTDNAGLSRLAFNSAATHMSQTVDAVDAALTLNGLNITSADNQVTDAVEGVTLQLNEVTESAVTLRVEHNTAAIASSVQGMVDAYNNLRGRITTLSGYNEDSGVGGLLQGDFTINAIDNRIKGLLSANIEGLSADTSSLAQVGITTGSDGRLTLDAGMLSEAMTERLEEVVALFSSVARSSTDSLEVSAYTDDTAIGDYAVNITQAASAASLAGDTVLPDFGGGGSLVIDANNDSFTIKVDQSEAASITLTQGTYTSGEALAAEIQARINSASEVSAKGASVTVVYSASDNSITLESARYGLESVLEITSVDTNTSASLGLQIVAELFGTDVEGTIGGETATGVGRKLTAADGGNAAGLSLLIGAGDSGSLGTISVSRGLFHNINALLTEYMDSDTGIIQSRREGLDDQLERLTEDRKVLDARIDRVEARYRKQFTSLDILMMQLRSTSDYLTVQLDNLPGPYIKKS